MAQNTWKEKLQEVRSFVKESDKVEETPVVSEETTVENEIEELLKEEFAETEASEETLESLQEERQRLQEELREVEEKIKAVKEVRNVKVNITFDPPWDKDMMSEEAKLELGML